MSLATGPHHDLAELQHEVDQLVGSHPVVTDNAYTSWFATGRRQHGRRAPSHRPVLGVQPPVRRGPAAEGDQRARPSTRIGPARRSCSTSWASCSGHHAQAAVDEAIDPALVATEGTVDGGRFRFGAAHFEWLLRFAAPLGLGFDDLGKRRHATPATEHFCDELLRVYGSEDTSVAEGASYAVEHWAAAGFWKELIAGLDAYARPHRDPAAACLLDLARPGRGPARRPHRRRAGRSGRARRVRRRSVPRRRRGDARRREGVLGRPRRRPAGGPHRGLIGGQRPRSRRSPRWSRPGSPCSSGRPRRPLLSVSSRSSLMRAVMHRACAAVAPSSTSCSRASSRICSGVGSLLPQPTTPVTTENARVAEASVVRTRRRRPIDRVRQRDVIEPARYPHAPGPPGASRPAARGGRSPSTSDDGGTVRRVHETSSCTALPGRVDLMGHVSTVWRGRGRPWQSMSRPRIARRSEMQSWPRWPISAPTGRADSRSGCCPRRPSRGSS